MLNKNQKISNPEQLVGPLEHDVRHSVLSKTEEMLVIMKNNEAMTKEILKSVRFIKSYYFWRSAFNILRFLVLAGVVILGIISWNSIMDFIKMSMDSYVGTKIPSTIDQETINRFLR